MSIFSCKVCTPSDPATDTVKVSVPDEGFPASEEGLRTAAEAEALRVAEEAEEAARRAAAEEEAQRQAGLEAEQQRAAEARRIAEEQARARAQEEEINRREAERLQKEEEKAEATRLETEERKKAVSAFLAKYKFKGVTAPKRSMFSTTYPLHRAAEIGNESLVEMLIKEGADAMQKNSAGKTAAQVAQKKDKNGSHAAVLQALRTRA